MPDEPTPAQEIIRGLTELRDDLKREVSELAAEYIASSEERIRREERERLKPVLDFAREQLKCDIMTQEAILSHYESHGAHGDLAKDHISERDKAQSLLVLIPEEPS